MIFITQDLGAAQPKYFTPSPYLEVAAASRTDAYKGRQMSRIAPVSGKKEGGQGFSNILAEEEDAILAELQ